MEPQSTEEVESSSTKATGTEDKLSMIVGSSEERNVTTSSSGLVTTACAGTDETSQLEGKSSTVIERNQSQKKVVKDENKMTKSAESLKYSPRPGKQQVSQAAAISNQRMPVFDLIGAGVEGGIDTAAETCNDVWFGSADDTFLNTTAVNGLSFPSSYNTPPDSMLSFDSGLGLNNRVGSHLQRDALFAANFPVAASNVQTQAMFIPGGKYTNSWSSRNSWQTLSSSPNLVTPLNSWNRGRSTPNLNPLHSAVAVNRKLIQQHQSVAPSTHKSGFRRCTSYPGKSVSFSSQAGYDSAPSMEESAELISPFQDQQQHGVGPLDTIHNLQNFLSDVIRNTDSGVNDYENRQYYGGGSDGLVSGAAMENSVGNLTDFIPTGIAGDLSATPRLGNESSEKYSRKVFVGGLPPDIDEDEITASFRRFGPLVVDWPHKAESKSFFPPKGYAFLLFQEELSVRQLIDACIQEEDKLYLMVSSPTVKDKAVQIRPWRISDADYVVNAALPLDPRKTVFVGGVPRPLKAVELANIMERYYGGVCYAGIDTDPDLKYPKGAGRVAFSNQHSYIAAISARFVQLQHADIDKRVEVKPYVLDDQMCDECAGQMCCGKFAPFFCANVHCLQYYCEHCWTKIHARLGREFHKPLVKEGADRPRLAPPPAIGQSQQHHHHHHNQMTSQQQQQQQFRPWC